MPGPSWSIDAQRCITGSKLAEIPGTACSVCYARKGRFTIGPTLKANEKRLAAYYAVPDWPQKMAQLVELSVSVGDPYFRWFSSGDLQSVDMLLDIMRVCWLTPGVRHWLPTEERGFVQEAQAIWQREHGAPHPPNLVIRVSAPEINGVIPADFPHTSVIVGPKSEHQWAARVKYHTNTRWHCPASLNEKYECGSCRACWAAEVETVVYKLR